MFGEFIPVSTRCAALVHSDACAVKTVYAILSRSWGLDGQVVRYSADILRSSPNKIERDIIRLRHIGGSWDHVGILKISLEFQ